MKDKIIVNIGTNHQYLCDTKCIARAGENLNTQLEITLAEELSEYWAYLDFEKSNGETFKTPRLEIVENKIIYDIPSSVLDVGGDLFVQLVLQKESGDIWKSEIKKYYVKKSIDAVNEIVEKEDFIAEVQKMLDKYDYSKFTQAYIKDGRLVCNDTTADDQETAKYIGADVKYPVKYAEIKFGFTGDTEKDSASVLLILSNRGNTLKHHITHGSIHIGVTPTSAGIQFFWDNTSVLHTIQSRTFKQPLQPNTEYSLKFEYYVHASQVETDEYCIKVTFPDGTYYNFKPTDAKTFNLGGTNYNAFEILNALNGRYIMFEHFYDNPSTVRGYYTSWCASAPENMAEFMEAYRQRLMYDLDKTKGNANATVEYTYTHDVQYLRHKFANQTFDGALPPAQTGQTYTLFADNEKCEHLI